MAGIGPIDPDLARELAAAAARNSRSTWHVTVTDQDGHAVAHGCARPVTHRKAGGHDPPGGPEPSGGPGFTFTPAGNTTWRLTAGNREMLVRIEALPGRDCDHRHQVRLRAQHTVRGRRPDLPVPTGTPSAGPTTG